MEVVKLCTKCGKPGKFGRRKRSKDGLKSACNKCESLRQKKWYAENSDRFKGYVRNWNERHPEQYKAIRKSSSLKRLYGLSTDDFLLLLKLQDNKCAICRL